MVVWLGIQTLVFGGLAVVHSAENNNKAAALALIVWATFCVLWTAYVFRGFI